MTLLYAMALDKNYIDICSDSIIRPALDYYSNRGVYDDRMKAYYYRGVVGRNKGNSEEAMQYYILAERLVGKCRDYNAIGRLYNAMMNIHIELHEYSAAFKSAEQASNAYLIAGNMPRYYDALIDMLNAAIIKNMDDSRDACMQLIKGNWGYLSKEQRGRYFLIISSRNVTDVLLNNALPDSYFHDFDNKHREWLVIAMLRYHDNDFIGLENALAKFTECSSSDQMENPLYLLLNSLALENQLKYKEALDLLRRAMAIMDEQDLKIFESDTKFLVERYNATIKKRKLKNGIIFLSISIILVISISFTLIQSHKRKETEYENEVLRYQVLYREALLEQEKLKKSRKDTALGKNVRKIVNERLEVLNNFILANISDTFSKKASEELRNLMSDREHFLESTHKSFVVAHPQFLMFLKQFNLSSKEIGYCCLYCIGLNGSEIADYLERKSFYNISHALRTKMGLDRSTNLDTYLRTKMQELDNNSSLICSQA